MHLEAAFVHKPDTLHGITFVKKHFPLGYLEIFAVNSQGRQPFFGTVPAEEAILERAWVFVDFHVVVRLQVKRCRNDLALTYPNFLY